MIALTCRFGRGSSLPSRVAFQRDVQGRTAHGCRIDPRQARDPLDQRPIVNRRTAQFQHSRPEQDVDATTAGGIGHDKFSACALGLTHTSTAEEWCGEGDGYPSACKCRRLMEIDRCERVAVHTPIMRRN